MAEKKNKFIFTIISVALGVFIGLEVRDFLVPNEVDDGVGKIESILQYTSKYYIEEVDSKKLVDVAITSMLNELDPHSVYIPPADQKIAEEEFRGNFDGIGIEFQIIDDTINVVSPISGGPSESLGISAGDRIIAIDSANCVGFSNDEVIKNLRGEKGTTVDITIFRPSSGEMLDYTIIRDEIPIYSVDVSLMINDSTGYISLSRFAETTSLELMKALTELRAEGLKNLIFDLRNNPGGLLSQAFQVADLFIDGDKLIVYTKGRIAEMDEEFFANTKTPFEEIPLIVLINRGSASASEIVAGAIQDWDRGLILGETSFGKGLVQRPFILPDNSAVRITISRYHTPSGRAIQRPWDDKDNYYTDVLNREGEKEEENGAHESEADSSRPAFTTAGGRTVYGGGGITPDYTIPNKMLPEVSVTLRRLNLYYEFIRSYLDKNRDKIANIYKDNYKKFAKQFKFSDNEIDRFLKFIKSRGVKYSREEILGDIEYIKSRLKAYIARDLWKNKGWYYILLQEDNQYSRAVSLFDQIDDILKRGKED